MFTYYACYESDENGDREMDEIIKHGKKYQPVIGKVRLINGKDLYENYKSKPKKKFLQILLSSLTAVFGFL